MFLVLTRTWIETIVGLRGAHVAGIVPVKEELLNAAVNEELAGQRGRIQQLEIKILESNRFQVNARVAIGPFEKWFRPELILNPQAIWSQSPMVLLTVASAQYGALTWLVELFAKELLPDGVHVKGRQIAIDLAGTRQAAEYRPYFQHLKQLKLHTSAGKLSISFEIRID